MPYAGQSTDNTLDPATGLPHLGAALVDIRAQTHRPEEGFLLGAVVFQIPPSPPLYRLTPEAVRQLRIDISLRLDALLRPKDGLYSIGPWEWLVVLPGLPSGAPLLLAALKLARAFDGLFPTIDGSALPLRATCGAALWPDHGDNPLHLVQSARIAALHATEAELYRPDMEHIDASQHELHQKLRQALRGHGKLDLHLQPQVELVGGACVGAEALLRWQLEDGTWVPPHHTLAVVARFGLGKEFNRWLLQRAAHLRRALVEAEIDIVLSINLSANDLLDPELPDLIEQTLSTWALPADRLLLEITETTMVADDEQVSQVLERLRQLGLFLSIDDFGTGYSGMSHLERLPVQEVKIDQSFVRRIADSERNREIVASIAQLAHRLGLHVVAEGVETEAVRQAVADIGCERAQGFLFSRALPLDGFIAWWRERYPA